MKIYIGRKKKMVPQKIKYTLLHLQRIAYKHRAPTEQEKINQPGAAWEKEVTSSLGRQLFIQK